MKTILTSCLVLLSTLLTAQNILQIKGKVVNANTQKAVAYAHVGIPSLAIGTITADNGEFVLKIPGTAKDHLLRVSFIGYNSFETKVRDWESNQVIQLEQVPTTLTEILVRDESKVEDIIRRAVKRIPQNYPNYPTVNKGFYRESRTNSDQEYIYLAEGVLKTYKHTYAKKKEGHVQIIEGRQVALVPDSVLAESGWFTSGHMSGLRFDIVQNREDFINESFFNAYKYWMQGITAYNDRPVYVIGFDQQGNEKNGRMRGTIYIDTLSLAFVRTEFEITEDGLKKRSDYPLYAGSWKGNSYIVNYRQQGDKWILGDATREGTYRDGGLYMNEYLVTEAPPGKSKPLPYADRVGRESAFRNITGEYDKEFWKDYNTSPLKSDLKETVQQKENNRIAEEVFEESNMERLQLIKDSLKTARANEGYDFDPSSEKEMKAFIIETTKRKALANFQMLSYSSAGIHMMKTPGAKISMTYFPTGGQTENISVSQDMASNDWAYILRNQLDFLFKNKWAFSWGWNYELLDDVYKNVSLGVNFQQKLTKGRPLFLRLGVHYDRTKYYKFIGQAENTIGEFEAENKTFKAPKVNMYLGSRVRSIMGSASLSLELNPQTEIYVQAAYRQPFQRTARAYLWERERFFLARKKVEVKDLDSFQISKNDSEFSGHLSAFDDWQFNIGLVKKTNFR